ncbi:hypothetical protein NRK67_00515 [Fusobacteria bacterium ZRK30]|nr:hypothetical protein NRK67_00515 [Fusobacteria bacterium ZRK30]
MKNIPNELYEEIKSNMKRPEGTVTFEYRNPELFNSKSTGGTILEVITGDHIFLLQQSCDFKLKFIHFSPGTETRVAIIDLKKIKKSPNVLIILRWSTSEIKLSISPAPLIKVEDLTTSIGIKSDTSYRVIDGNILEIGGPNTVVMGTRIMSEGKCVLAPTAIETWNNTIDAIKILQSSESEKGYSHEVVLSNLTISTLVTGFETYAMKRCIEISKEGVQPDIPSLVKRVYSTYERENDYPKHDEIKAKEKGNSFYEELITNMVNFQSYQECKQAFSKSYGIKFGEIDYTANLLENLQKIIKFRHKIIHVSPMLTIINEEEVPKEKPIFSNKDYAEKSINTFNEFIQKLHNTTLKLQRVD